VWLYARDSNGMVELRIYSVAALDEGIKSLLGPDAYVLSNSGYKACVSVKLKFPFLAALRDGRYGCVARVFTYLYIYLTPLCPRSAAGHRSTALSASMQTPSSRATSGGSTTRWHRGHRMHSSVRSLKPHTETTP
jgi:hypothetical protein